VSELYTAKTEAWAERWGFCWRCNERGLWALGSLQIHHFVRGSNRHKNDIRTMLLLCERCHLGEHIGHYPLGLPGSLALKRKCDLENYDLAAVNRLRGRAPGAITEEEVNEAAEAAGRSE